MRGRALLCAVVAAIAVAVVAGCGGGTSSTSSISPNAAKKPTNPCRNRAVRSTGTRPARIIPGGNSPYPEAVIGPVRNAWTVSVGDRSTTVYAGGQGYRNPKKGRFLIAREGASPKTDSVDVSLAGVLKITRAPVGCDVIGWAQKRGVLHFTSTNGVTGILDLKGDSVAIDAKLTVGG